MHGDVAIRSHPGRQSQQMLYVIKTNRYILHCTQFLNIATTPKLAVISENQ